MRCTPQIQSKVCPRLQPNATVAEGGERGCGPPDIQLGLPGVRTSRAGPSVGLLAPALYTPPPLLLCV